LKNEKKTTSTNIMKKKNYLLLFSFFFFILHQSLLLHGPINIWRWQIVKGIKIIIINVIWTSEKCFVSKIFVWNAQNLEFSSPTIFSLKKNTNNNNKIIIINKIQIIFKILFNYKITDKKKLKGHLGKKNFLIKNKVQLFNSRKNPYFM